MIMLLFLIYIIYYHYVTDKTKTFSHVNNIKMENNKFENSRIKKFICYYFNDMIKFEDLDFDNILIDEKSYENILIYNISY